MSTTTVRTHHTPTVATAAAATLALAAVLAVGAVVTERITSDTSPSAPARVLPVDVPAPVEWQFGSPDALERRLTGGADTRITDPRLYGSPDATERILGR